MTRPSTDQLKDFLRRVLPSNDLDELVSGDIEAESMTEGAGAPPAMADPVRRAAEKLQTGQPLAPDEQFVTEAIIIPDKRPAIDVLGGDYTVTHALWLHYDTDAGIKQRLRAAIRSIGRVELPELPGLPPYAGTAFMVGPDLMMTNRHVAEAFASGLGLTNLRFKPGLSADVDFLRERGDEEEAIVGVREVAMIHPYWDMAVLRIDAAAGRGSVKLAVDPLAAGEDVAVIGYPAFDPRNDAAVQHQVFGGVYGVKRLQPGKLGEQRSVRSFGRDVMAGTHDSSTLGGNSGSAVVSARTGAVLALHFGGRYLDANFCVPANELARDARVVDAGVSFAGTPTPGPGPADPAWQQESTPAGAAATAGPSLAARGEISITLPLTITVALGRQ